MGFRKRFKKLIRKTPQYKAVKAVKGFFKAPEMDDSGDDGMRSEAAKRLVDQQKQAGSGQIKYTTEESE